jgi:hypothetical protein
MPLTKAWIQDAACHDEFANGALVDDALDTMLMLDTSPNERCEDCAGVGFR